MNSQTSYSKTTETIYSNKHNVNVSFENGLTNFRSILIDINKHKQSQSLEVKLRDHNDPLFSFTAHIDRPQFEKMKGEQYLDICFEEFHLQFIELLQQTISKQMLLKLEHGNTTCKMVFYEKSKIKSLIFLVIYLSLTDQTDIIKEMIANINQLQELNQNVNMQLQATINQVKDMETSLNSALSANCHLEKQFLQGLKLIEKTSFQSLGKIEKQICCEIDKLNNRYDKVIKNIDKVKKENVYRENLYGQTTFQLEQFKKNCEKNCKVIASLNVEVDILTSDKRQNEKIATDLRQSLMKKESDVEKLTEEIGDLRRDIQEATIIIAQKGKTHDEIAKDLVQANVMLVNFNKQYSGASKEINRLEDVIKNKDQALQERADQVQCLREQFAKYKLENNPENFNDLQYELRKSQKRIEELEKNNRDAAKVNGLLTRKLASGDI